MITIFQKEFRSYFTSPIGYVLMTFFIFIFGLYFVILNLFSQNGDFSLVVGSLTTILLFTTPILTMRLLSEEKKNRTDQLLLTLPINPSDIVVGKFLAAISLLGLTLVCTMIYPLILSFIGPIPIGKIVGVYIGYFLLGVTLIAIGLFISALSENQIVSAIGTIGVFLILLFIDSIAVVLPNDRTSSLCLLLLIAILFGGFIYQSLKNLVLAISISTIAGIGIIATYIFKGIWFDGLTTKLFQWLSVFQRFNSFSRGQFDVASTVYFLSFIVLFVFLTIQVLHKRTWS